MSASFQGHDLNSLREALLQLNTQLLYLIQDRRQLAMHIQEIKAGGGRFAHFDPEREKVLFHLLKEQLIKLSLKELLAFSLIMEDQAMAMAPGTYPAWSTGMHLTISEPREIGRINPLMLKVCRPELFEQLSISPDFSFLKDF